MELDPYDFFNLVGVLFEAKIEEQEAKEEERLFNLWGYQLPLMKDPMSYWDFRRKVEEKSKPRTAPSKAKNELSNEELIEKVERIKAKHQKKVGEQDRAI